MWAEGLISAAKAVASSMRVLVGGFLFIYLFNFIAQITQEFFSHAIIDDLFSLYAN